MSNRIQPQDKIGPNNAGKMILRGCFMNVSREWLEHDDNPIGGLLSRYLKNRLGEATTISLNHGDCIPPEREAGPEKVDMDFMASTIFRLRGMEKSGTPLQHATAREIHQQVRAQVDILQQEIEKYTKNCAEENLKPLFTGVPGVIIENVLSRTAVTHDESLTWEYIGGAEPGPDLFEGMTVHGGYEPPTLR